MGAPKDTSYATYTDFFYKPYEEDYTRQYIKNKAEVKIDEATIIAEAKQARSTDKLSDEEVEEAKESARSKEVEKIQAAYEHSHKILSRVQIDFLVLQKIINDPDYELLSKQQQQTIVEQYQKSLKLLLVHATSANYRVERDELAAALASSALLLETNTATTAGKKAAEKENFLQTARNIQENIANLFRQLFEFHPSDFLNFIGRMNLYRLSYTFSRLSWKQLWLYLKSEGYITAKDKINGFFINIGMMDYPTSVFNLFSILIFVIKLTIYLPLILIVHPFMPSVAEKGFTWKERMKMEFAKRAPDFANDSFWLAFNGITNYPQYFGISIPVAGWILTAALFFDAGLLSIILYLENKKITEKQAWLNTQMYSPEVAYSALATNNKFMLELMQKHAEVLRAEIWAKLMTCVVATGLFIAALALSLSIASPLVTPFTFFACIVAVALILSSGKIGAVASARASRLHKSCLIQDEVTQNKRLAKENEAWVSFGQSFAKHIVVPMFIIGLFTINWQAALAVAAVYITYECLKSHSAPPQKPDMSLEPNTSRLTTGADIAPQMM